MKWIKQKSGDKNCGQIALAVITNRSLKTIIKLIGHNTYTNTRELVNVLHKLNYKCPKRLKIFKKNIPKLAIAKLTSLYKSNWHWVVVYKNKIYDGVNGNKKGSVIWNEGQRITSYLPIKKRI